MTERQTSKLAFDVDAALLVELGERLVARRSVALAELIKNAYDADATEVIVSIEDVTGPNEWGAEIGNPRYIIDLVKRVTTVRVDTMSIVRALPPLEEAAHTYRYRTEDTVSH